MRYYVTSDLHGYYRLFRASLHEAGWDEDTGTKKLLVCGDLMDRGREALEMERYISALLDRDEVILVKGNHEWLYQELIEKDHGMPLPHHMHNRTFDTLLQLTETGMDSPILHLGFEALAAAGTETDFYRTILPACRNFYETPHYIFTHGYIPEGPSWRNADDEAWEFRAVWLNGMECSMQQGYDPGGKTVVCGHWHTSYGHSVLHQNGPEFGEGAIFDVFCDEGILALDACTAYSQQVNVVVIED